MELENGDLEIYKCIILDLFVGMDSMNRKNEAEFRLYGPTPNFSVNPEPICYKNNHLSSWQAIVCFFLIIRNKWWYTFFHNAAIFCNPQHKLEQCDDSFLKVNMRKLKKYKMRRKSRKSHVFVEMQMISTNATLSLANSS